MTKKGSSTLFMSFMTPPSHLASTSPMETSCMRTSSKLLAAISISHGMKSTHTYKICFSWMVSPSGHPPLPISTLMVIRPFSITSFHPMTSSSKATNIMKPCPMDCCALSGQHCLINMLSTYMLGSGGNSLYPSETVKKNANFQLMLPEW